MNIVILAGSNRKEATSTKLCKYIERVLKSHNHHVRFFDLYESPLPLYSPDEDVDGEPQLVRMKQWFVEADAIILSTPEYHGGPTGVLKNALDHLGGEHFDGKPVLCCSSSGGAVGVGSLLQLQAIVRNVHGINCPEWISIGGEQRKFNDSGEPENLRLRERILRALKYFQGMGEKLAE
jgi:azobenzene reductase